MSDPEVYVSRVDLQQDRICVPAYGQDPGDCGQHDHVPGTRDLSVSICPIATSDAAEAAFRGLVGKRVRLVVVAPT